MSLGDYVRFLRAVKGGVTPWEMAEEADIPAGEYRQVEQRYREMASDEMVEGLARYFDVPAEELLRRREWSRKALSADLDRARRQRRVIHLTMRTGDCLSGWIEWFDLGATLLRPSDGTGETVVQRHMVEEWKLEPATENAAEKATQEAAEEE